MCTRLILDANRLDLVTGGDNHDPFLVALLENGGGMLCLAGDGKFAAELSKNAKFSHFVRELRKTGGAFTTAPEQLKEARRQLKRHIADNPLVSDDRHVLEVALASHASVLVSKDKDLRKDFKPVMRLRNISAKLYPHCTPEKNRRDFIRRHWCKRR